MAVYKLMDTPSDKKANPEPFGLVRRDGSRRLAFDTYRAAIKQFQGATAVTRDRWDEIGQFQINQETQTTTLLFSRLPQPQVARVPALVEQAKLVNMWGKRLEDVVAYNGVFTIELPGALFCTRVYWRLLHDWRGVVLFDSRGALSSGNSDRRTSRHCGTDRDGRTNSPAHQNTCSNCHRHRRDDDSAYRHCGTSRRASPTVVVKPTEVEVMSTVELVMAVPPTAATQPANKINVGLYWSFVGLLLVLLLIRWFWDTCETIMP